ncbi:MAG: lysophospholipase [Planctomycetota bacterium]|nr:lysophospholipase [Planctomycetota bacterium]
MENTSNENNSNRTNPDEATPSKTSRNETTRVEWSAGYEEFAGLRAIVLRPPGTSNSRALKLGASESDDSENGEWLLLCHGFGASAEDLFGLAEPLVSLFEQQSRKPLMVFPEAPIDMSDFGMEGGRAWWPLNMAKLLAMAQSNNFDSIRNEEPPGLDYARTSLLDAIDAMTERFGLSTRNLILGGFSQGAMLAADIAIRGLKTPPQRLVLFSGAMICQTAWTANADALAETVVFQSHGLQDPVLPIQTGKWLGEFMAQHAKNATFHTFRGGHGIPPEAIEALAKL